ncbi:MAG: signal recognition particle-docking protein FtsY [Alphaproteobacteria bacterium]|nr:signal recognition particle-docking protein FtsY [Alphaproteobacteria bacterium]
MSWLSGLFKTSNPIVNGISSLLTKKKLDKDVLESLNDLLIMADVGVATSEEMIDSLSKDKFEKEITDLEIRQFFANEIAKRVSPYAKEIEIDKTKKPFVIMMVGVNGAGKTTTIGKMAAKMKKNGLKVRFAAADTFRAAAVEQLKVWAERTNCPIVAKQTGSDPAGLVFDAIKESIANEDDVLFIDTAGRLQNKSELMAELEKINRIIKKLIPDGPHACLQVLDATVGQNAKSQVQAFSSMVNVTGLIITKLDGTAKGGVLIPLTQEFKLPINAVGIGEQIEDLKAFDPNEYAKSMMAIN